MYFNYFFICSTAYYAFYQTNIFRFKDSSLEEVEKCTQAITEPLMVSKLFAWSKILQ